MQGTSLSRFMASGGFPNFGSWLKKAGSYKTNEQRSSSGSFFGGASGFGFSAGGLPNKFGDIFGSRSWPSGSDAGGLSGGNAGDNKGGGGFGGPLGGFFDKALEWCSEAHARSISRRQGIDVRDIKFEKTPEGGIKVIVDAPNATVKQIEQLGEQVMEECPVARFRKTQVTSPQQRFSGFVFQIGMTDSKFHLRLFTTIGE
ncbi:hypothetical protein ERJ75_001763000 [Trypanosoma vivax]|nr:hypothetical protein ERJ75_001763000 [Trypanosoma vivax]